MTAAVCTLGPVTVDQLPSGTAIVDPMLVCAAMDGGDGRFVLVGDEPVPLAQVWIDTLRPLLDGADRALLIHPSWWTVRRVDTVRAAAAELSSGVELRSRSAVLAHRHPAAVLVEVAAHVVLVMHNGVAVKAHERSSPPEVLAQRVADTVLAAGPGRAVVIDAPTQVPGAEVLAALLGAALTGVVISISGDRQLGWAATTLVAAGRTDLRPGVALAPRWPALLLVIGLTAAVLAIAVVLATGARRDPPAAVPLTALVEGAVTVQVPEGWAVRRVTDGPGSARVQVISPADPDAVLHLTQSRLVSTDLAATADALRRAVDAQPPGTFVDFDPADHRAGRPVVTYREVRPGRDIVWTVLVDGDVRISIGCQNALGRSIAVAAACDDAVRTAQRLR